MKVSQNPSKSWIVLRSTISSSFLILGLIPVFQSTASAQTPEPTVYMKNIAPGGAYPSGAGAVIVEGLGLIGDCDTEGDLADIEADTVAFTQDDEYVIDEITPQYYGVGNCGTYTQYETAINSLATYIEANAHYPRTYWGGIMLDEEGSYGVTEAHLVDLNNYTDTVMTGTTGTSWYFTEDQPNAWTLAQYNDIVGSSYMAPQAYTSDMVDFINGECASPYYNCVNLVTVDRSGSGDWSDTGYVLPLVDGAPWSVPTWGTDNWWNAWWST